MASIHGQGNILSVKLTASVTRGRIVRFDGTFSGGIPVVVQATDPAAATGHYNGPVALTSGVAGDIIDVQLDGLCSFGTAAGALTPGRLVTTDGAGKFAHAVAGDVAIGRFISGKDSDGSSNNNEECIVILGINRAL
jgi:hypothetical protein